MITTTSLSMSDVLALAQVLQCSADGAQVARVDAQGHVTRGTARHLSGDADGGYFTGTDVREAYLRVTLVSGWEAFWPVAELAAEARRGEFVRVKP